MASLNENHTSTPAKDLHTSQGSLLHCSVHIELKGNGLDRRNYAVVEHCSGITVGRF